MPECLMIEAMAQTAGILVGEARAFKEKVILAKIQKAAFRDVVRPGDSIELEAVIDSISPEAASAKGRITRDGQPIAEIDLMFSHIDQNMAGMAFPAENFVFENNTFKALLRDFSSSHASKAGRSGADHG
jgi:3-hydroxyacyl-[acyl-carrier-protein] dehydratase